MDPTIPTDYMQYAMARESGGDPNAQNPRSSASGLFQFTNGTADTVRLQHPELGLTSDWKNDPQQSPIGMQAFTQDNAKQLSAGGYPVNNNTLYLAHRFGADGAIKALNADVSAPVSSVFNAGVMKANPDLANKKIGDLYGGTPATGNTPMPSPMDVAQQAQQPVLFGGNPTPVGAIGGLGRMLGIGTEDGLGNHLKNAGAALIAVGDPKGGAALQNAANAPHFNVVTDALGNRYAIDTRTGMPMSVSGAGIPGATAGGQQGPLDTQQGLAQTPVALAAKAEQEQKDSHEKMASLEDAAGAAQNFIDQNKQAMALSQDPGTLQGPGLTNMFRDKIADMTNGSFGGVDIAKQHELDKLNQQLVSTSLSGLKGIRFAAPEIKFGQQASADLEKPAATNQQIYSNNIQNAQRVIDARDIARKHMSQFGVLGNAYSAELQDYQNKNPVYQDTAVHSNPGGPPANRPALGDIFK